MNIPYDRRADVFADWLDAQVTGRSTPDAELQADAELADVCAAADQFHGLDAGLGQFATVVSPTPSRWEDIMVSHAIEPGATGQPVGVSNERSSLVPFERKAPAWDRVLSAVLAAAVVLALGAGALRVFDLGGFGGNKPPSEVSYGGFLPWEDKSQQVLPEVTVPPDVEVSSIPWPSADECTVEPLTRDEVVAMFEAANTAMPAGGSWYERPVEPTTDERQAMVSIYRTWQACTHPVFTGSHYMRLITPWQLAMITGIPTFGPLNDDQIQLQADMAMATPEEIGAMLEERGSVMDGYWGKDRDYGTPGVMPEETGPIPVPANATPVAIPSMSNAGDYGWMLFPDEIQMVAPDRAEAALYLVNTVSRDVNTEFGTQQVTFVLVDGEWIIDEIGHPGRG